ncbi:hypothetical protein [Candidatus Palauibacter sp.]|uniref:hypothetical protein n=1 Tax=Candidatus Palauibacter sp. TaxID=3101350 RepID=UPI003D0BC19F
MIEHCPAFAERARAGEIVAKLNHTVRVNYQDWNIDLAVGPPPGSPVPPNSNLRKNPDLPYGAPRAEDPKLVTGTPAPRTGDPMDYATMIRRICTAYEDRWQRRTR